MICQFEFMRFLHLIIFSVWGIVIFILSIFGFLFLKGVFYLGGDKWSIVVDLIFVMFMLGSVYMPMLMYASIKNRILKKNARLERFLEDQDKL